MASSVDTTTASLQLRQIHATRFVEIVSRYIKQVRSSELTRPEKWPERFAALDELAVVLAEISQTQGETRAFLLAAERLADLVTQMVLDRRLRDRTAPDDAVLEFSKPWQAERWCQRCRLRLGPILVEGEEVCVLCYYDEPPRDPRKVD